MSQLILGRHSYGNPKVHGEKSRIFTGSFCSISDFSTFDAGFQHNSRYISQFPFSQKLPGLHDLADRHPATYGDTVLMHDVWVADQAFIRSGVTIGTGAIIGYGAVITKNVRDYAVMAGNPAREVRRRYSDDIIGQLLLLAWWDWPDEKIKENVPLLMSDNIEDFLNKHL